MFRRVPGSGSTEKSGNKKLDQAFNILASKFMFVITIPRLMFIGVELILRSCSLLAIPKYIFPSFNCTCSEPCCEHIQFTVTLDTDMGVCLEKSSTISKVVVIAVIEMGHFFSVPQGAVEKHSDQSPFLFVRVGLDRYFQWHSPVTKSSTREDKKEKSTDVH